MKTNNKEIMLSVRIQSTLLDKIDRVSRNKFATRSSFIRAVLQKEVDKTR